MMTSSEVGSLRLLYFTFKQNFIDHGMYFNECSLKNILELKFQNVNFRVFFLANPRAEIKRLL